VSGDSPRTNCICDLDYGNKLTLDPGPFWIEYIDLFSIEYASTLNRAH